ncbi:ATP-dependent nuclease [Bdellovibrio sp.]|uniref:ATP-dependent nuclease n=1 Tax=Bdellovibrio sp. TaxID=28201 RepID=UPI0039E5067D
MKISRIEIKRFRSIQDITFDIDQSYNLISFCGENNAGKTNILRSISLFFHPNLFDNENDVPIHKQASAGGKVFPEIAITFISKDKKIRITRIFEYSTVILEGEETDLVTSKPKQLDQEVCEKILSKYVCKFIEVINLSIPDLIEELIQEVYDIEYEKSRFKGAKQKLKEAFEDYHAGVLEILKELATDITPDFEKFNSDWGVDFSISTDVKKFRDLISDDVEFFVKDKSNKVIGSKGSGLQRLAFILLQSRIVSKLKQGKIPLLIIDEPETFLHPALQKQLKEHLLNLGQSGIQIFLTTHSPAFIDSYLLRNQFLIGIQIEENIWFNRVKKYVNKVSTYSIDLESIDGTQKIKRQLGLEAATVSPLEKFNMIVEGEADQRYLKQLLSYFELAHPNIVPAHGVANIEKLLDLYKGFYKTQTDTPAVLIMLDNDLAGREIFHKISKNIEKYKPLVVRVIFCPNYLGETPDLTNLQKSKENHEIEDLLYPEIFVNLVNMLLKKANYNEIVAAQIFDKIAKPAFKAKGILALVEDEKNESNPLTGQNITFSSSSHESEKMKTSISKLFNFEGDRKFIKLISENDRKYPEVRLFLNQIAEMDLHFFKND